MSSKKNTTNTSRDNKHYRKACEKLREAQSTCRKSIIKMAIGAVAVIAVITFIVGTGFDIGTDASSILIFLGGCVLMAGGGIAAMRGFSDYREAQKDVHYYEGVIYNYEAKELKG